MHSIFPRPMLMGGEWYNLQIVSGSCMTALSGMTYTAKPSYANILTARLASGMHRMFLPADLQFVSSLKGSRFLGFGQSPATLCAWYGHASLLIRQRALYRGQLISLLLLSLQLLSLLLLSLQLLSLQLLLLR